MTSLLQTKFYIPSPRPSLVVRPRLFDRLRTALNETVGEHTFNRRLTLISAPAGYGKTTLAAAWVRQADRAVAWLSLDEGDNDPARFLAYLTAAVQRAFPDAGSQVADLLGAPKLPPAETLVTLLLNDLAAREDLLILVLDDYHLIRDAAVHEAVTFLLDHVPPNLHLMILTRVDPPLPVARLRGQGQLIELRLRDLQFTPEEAADFLVRTVGQALAPAELSALHRRTEGWATGLQMAAVALQERPADAARFIQSFSGSNRYILDYLLEEVLANQTAAVQEFLLRTAVLDRLTGPLCDAILVKTSAAGQGRAFLDYLEKANLFIVALDDERRWYRYHRLFSDLLRKKLEEERPDETARMHRRASRWYEEEAAGQPSSLVLAEAIEHALAAGEKERAGQLIRQVAEFMFMGSQVRTVLRWLSELPDALLKHRPALAATYACALLISGGPIEEVTKWLDVAEKDSQAEGGQPRTELDSEIAAYRALIAAFQGDADASRRLSRSALAQLPRERVFLHTLLVELVGMAHVLSGDMAAAGEAFDEAVRQGRRQGDILLSVGSMCNRAGLDMINGRLRQAEAIYREALSLATGERGGILPIGGKALFGLGAVYQEWNELARAADCLEQGLALLKEYNEAGAIVGTLSLARIHQTKRDFQAAWRLIHQAEEMAGRFDASQLDDVVVALSRVQLALAEGDLSSAQEWLEKESTTVEEQPPYLQERIRAVQARVYLAQGQAAEALAILEPLFGRLEAEGRLGSLIKLWALQALLYQAQGKNEKALATLGLALRSARNEGYARVFLDEGEPMARLLYSAADQGLEAAYAGRLLAAFAGQAPVEPHVPAEQLIEPLSDRESEVLSLIAAGLTNREIAGRLSVTLSTVKGHTSHIYGKLSVNSRTQAIARARSLGLLETP